MYLDPAMCLGGGGGGGGGGVGSDRAANIFHN